jgi:hypothetical protein
MNTSTARLAAKLETLGISAENWCRIAEISTAKWSRAINSDRPGGVALTNRELVYLSKVARELEALVGGADPLPINFKNVEAVKRILCLCRGGVRWHAVAEPVESVESAEKVEPVEAG